MPRVVIPVVVSSGTALFALVGYPKEFVVAFGFIGSVVVVLERYFDPLGQAGAHTNKGDQLLSLYKDVRYFRNVHLVSDSPGDQVEREFDELRDRDRRLRDLDPRQFPESAYRKARKQINDGQAEYENDPLWVEPPESLG